MLNSGPLMFENGVTITTYAGDPNSHVSATAGSLVLDTVALTIWRNNGSTNLTEWVPDISIANATNTGVTLSLGSNNTLSASFTGSNVNHDTLALPNGNSNVIHLTGAQVAALHPAITVSNASNTGVTLTLTTNQGLSADFVGSNVPHNSLSLIQGGASSNYQHIARYATVAEAKAATGTAGDIIYCIATDQLYTFVAVSVAVADDDLILTTGSGGTTRWEALAKLTRAHGDNGWINSAGATISATSSTVVRLAMSAVGLFAVKGVRVDIPIGNYDCTISGAAGVKFVGFDDTSLVLKLRNTLWDFDKECPVMIAYWSGTAIVFAPQTEFHTAFRNTVWHLYAHLYQGMQYRSGLVFTGNVQTDNNTNPGADDTVTYLWSTDGILQDEDAACTPGVGQWLQTLGSGLTSTTAAIFGFAYFNGTAVISAAAMADRSPFLYSGANGTPQWNSAGTLTASVTGDYIVYHYFGNPMVGGWSIFARPHNAKFTSLTAAAAASPSNLTWSSYAELKHLYTAVFRVNTGWATTHRCKLVSLRSYRLTAGSPVAGTAATDHNALSNRAVAGCHPGTAISLDVTNFLSGLSSNDTSVQQAFDTLDDKFNLDSISTNTTLTTAHSVVSVTSTCTVSLPLVASVPNGKRYIIRVVSGTCSLNTTSGQTLDGVNGIYSIYANGAVEVISDGGFWYILWARYELTENQFSNNATISNRARYVWTSNGSAITLNLPNALLKTGKEICIKNGGSGIVTLQRNGTDTIDGATTFPIPVGGCLSLVLRSSTWQVTALFAPIQNLTAKTTPVDADALAIADSEASSALKQLTIANLKPVINGAVGTAIAAATAKTTPVDADLVALSDSEASSALKKLSIGDLKTAVGGGAGLSQVQGVQLRHKRYEIITPAAGTGTLTLNTNVTLTTAYETYTAMYAVDTNGVMVAGFPVFSTNNTNIPLYVMINPTNGDWTVMDPTAGPVTPADPFAIVYGCKMALQYWDNSATNLTI